MVCDDLVVMHLQYSTQWDSFAHVGSCSTPTATASAEAVYYNGFRAGATSSRPTDADDAGVLGSRRRASRPRGASALGIENMAEHCVQGRGVMIDLHAHFGRGRAAGRLRRS